MPLIPKDIKDIDFDFKDLFLDVKLETITINEFSQDFTGRPTFKTSFFRESIGFGITNVKVSTNASLQPTVDIEFKDLYGKTVFSESNQEDVDYKGIFQWPPPKFKFTFKGYLGQPVTWMLNMKTTSTQFNADDGSYTIRATFIPNQWGMFADMPFLYLFAAKKLKADRANPISASSNQEDLDDFQKKTESIIDLMYVGKKVEVLKNKKTKDFQKTINSLTLLKRDPVTGILGGTFKQGDEITEITPENTQTVVDSDGVSKFTRIEVSLPNDYDNLSEAEAKERIRSLSNNFRLVENIRIKLAILKKLGEPEGSQLDGFNSTESDGRIINEKKDASKKLDGIIDNNLEAIDEIIKGKIYSESQDEIKKLTIKEVFSRIAGDAAYILGYILDAGEQGYFNNQNNRSEAESRGEIIGRYFPMKWEEKEGGSNGGESLKSQVPAKDAQYGIENFELKFVNEFILAISEGIAQNRALQSQNFELDEDRIRHRVSNLEILSSNPFRNIIDWKEIASIIMKRASIAGYVTQSNLVNAPGQYDNKIRRNRNNSPGDIRKLASGDVVNIDDGILTKLEPENLEKLKEFCLFWMNLLDDSDGVFTGGKKFGEDILFKGGKSEGGDKEVNNIPVIIYKGNPSTLESGVDKTFLEQISNPDIETEELRNILKERIDKEKNVFINSNSLLDAGFKAYTVEEYLEQFIGPRYLFYGRSTRQAKNGVPYSEPTLQSTFNFYDTLSNVINFNNLTFIHNPKVKQDNFEFLVFEDSQDVQKLKEFQPGSNEGDSDLTKSGANSEKEKDSLTNYPKSIIFIDDIDFTPNPEKPNKKEETVEYKWWKKANGIQSTLQQAASIAVGMSEVTTAIGTFGASTLIPSDFKPSSGVKIDSNSFINYSWCKSRLSLESVIKNITEIDNLQDLGNFKIKQITRTENLRDGYEFKANLTNIGAPETKDTLGIRQINVTKKPIAVIPYAQNWNSNKECPTGGFFGKSALARSARVFIREFCVNLYSKIESLQDETSKVFGQILGKAGEHEDLLYQQMHNLFHQWQILALDENNSRINSTEIPEKLTPKVAEQLEERFSKSEETDFENSENKQEDKGDYSSGFIYSYPLQSRGEGNEFIKISESLINIEPLYNAKANTTVLNVLQQLCSKNNFLFFPIAGNSGFLKIENLFQPSFTNNSARISNSFQILFHPTPESRTLVGENEPISSKFKDELEDFSVKAFPVSFGDPTNKIIKSVVVGTDDNKVTAESIVNLQRIVDNENKNRTVTTDCSLLSVFEGRSYKAKLTTLGNSQISPMQFFFLRNHAIFTGLYQIMKVEHSITPNDMTTDFEGIKMRYAKGGYGGVLPITISDFEKAKNILKIAPNEIKVESRQIGQNINFETESNIPEDGSIGSDSFGTSVFLDDIEHVDYGVGNYLNHQWEGPLKDSNGKIIGSRPGQTSNFTPGKVDSILIHWSAGWTFDSAISQLKKSGLHYHMIIHENGTLYKVSDLDKFAWHGGGSTLGGKKGKDMNYNSIGISYVGGVEKGDGRAYYRSIEEWNLETWTPTSNNRQFKPKKQFSSILKACILAKRAHPSIKYITAHHWVTERKEDPGSTFPWLILLRKLREIDSSFNDVEILFNVQDQKGRGVVRPNSSPKNLQGDIDILI